MELRITRCPKDEITDSVAHLLELVDWAKDGHFPVAGGVLDQSQSFLYACRYLWAQEFKIEKEKHGEARRNH